MKKDIPKSLTKEELMELIRETNQPIDFDNLIENGILEKKGAWYKVLKFKELPSEVKARAVEMKQKQANGEVKELLLKFSKESKSLERTLKKYDAEKKGRFKP